MRGEAGGLLGGLHCDRGRRARDRAGRGAGAELRRRHRAARTLAHHRRLRLRHRHAARQWLRLRHALHGGRRLGPHADRARVLHHRQRVRQSVAAGVPRARRHRSGAGLRLFRAVGRACGDARQHRGRGAADRRGRAPARRAISCPSRASSIGGVAIGLLSHRRVPRRRPSLERHLRLHGVGRQDRRARSASICRSAEFWQWAGPKRALAESVLSDTSSLTDFGMLLGAMAAAAASKPFARAAWPPAQLAARRRASAAC